MRAVITIQNLTCHLSKNTAKFSRETKTETSNDPNMITQISCVAMSNLASVQQKTKKNGPKGVSTFTLVQKWFRLNSHFGGYTGDN